jgi:hypothetical protein
MSEAMKKPAAHLFAQALRRNIERRRQEVSDRVRRAMTSCELDKVTARGEFRAIVYLWRDRHGFKGPRG